MSAINTTQIIVFEKQQLKKAGGSVTEIMAMTGHKNQHSLADYNELDDEDHMCLSKILSSEKTSLSILQNSTVIFGDSSSSTLSQQFQLAHHCQKIRKRACIIESDSDSD